MWEEALSAEAVLGRTEMRQYHRPHKTEVCMLSISGKLYWKKKVGRVLQALMCCPHS